MNREPTSCPLLALVLSFAAATSAAVASTAAATEPPASAEPAAQSPAGAADASDVDVEDVEEGKEEGKEEKKVDAYRRSLWQRAVGRPDADPGYRLSFRLLHDIPLPGPLPDGLPRLVGDAVEINVAGGVARTAWAEGAIPQIDTSDDVEQRGAPVWAVDPAGKLRARFISSGHLVVQKRCRKCRKVWRRKWKLKVPGTILTRPLLTDNRIYYGAQDNRVYSLKKQNGHRLWVAELRDRVSAPVVLWDGVLEVGSENGAPRTREVQVILVVPDGGSVIVALDARTGREMARFDLRVEEGRLRGVPLRTPDGKILVAREKYRPGDASLMVLEFDAGNTRPAPEDEPPGDPAESDATAGSAIDPQPADRERNRGS